MTIKVLVIDDSPLMRALLTEIINAAGDLQVVGAAPDPLVAREMIKELNPHVLTLDVEMPKMDGLDFLRRLMKLRPTPVVMVSSLTERGSDIALRALELGAVDVVSKPRADFGDGLDAYGDEVCEKIRAAFGARLRPAPAVPALAGSPPAAGLVSGGTRSGAAPVRATRGALIAIGASTGGTEAIKEVLSGLPGGLPPILMVQHMPEMFTGSFARRLDALGPIRVKEAQGGERLEAGHAYLAPGHSHMVLVKRGGLYYCELEHSEPVNRHRPSVDVLFRTVAQHVGPRAVGVMLTGMGKDGAQGMLAMKHAGAWNIAQDQESCVVYGMPREAVAVGATHEVVGLREVAGRVLAALSNNSALARTG